VEVPYELAEILNGFIVVLPKRGGSGIGEYASVFDVSRRH
jgi:hypothetical protein